MWFHGIEESLKYKRVMKILHISYSDNNGAGLCALRIHKSMLDAGVDSKILVANKSSNLPSVFVAEESDLNRYSPPKNKLLRKEEIVSRHWNDIK